LICSFKSKPFFPYAPARITSESFAKIFFKLGKVAVTDLASV